ncbi:protein disulfide-isomerase A5 [Anabrus simplex]|uniref:protein disulfide-isomerase A5 n=1 Tax=Anabrus simplex TaxID=316456 RepID=UPI0034DD7E0E
MSASNTRIGLILFVVIVLLCEVPKNVAKQNVVKTAVEEVTDFKEFKKILRTKNNVLVCFVSSVKQAVPTIKIFREAAETIKGQGTMLLVDCSGEAKKMCKKLKVTPEPFVLKHYKDGEFHKDYDRLMTAQSMVNFMRDPGGDIPWEEDSSAVDVVHIPDASSLQRFLRKELRPVMVMFYAPWCGFCKQLKPEYSSAASELKGHSVMAAIDVNRPENAIIRQQYNITGFPTLHYYEGGSRRYIYEGENNKNSLVKFMKNPTKPPEKAKEIDWSETESYVVHLTETNFDSFLKDKPSVLVMFYAPWCGHCKKMKPEFERAAERLKEEHILGVLAAVDATKEASLGARYNIRGYPTVKYFKNGEVMFDANVRDAAKIVEFMKDPKEPPPPPPPEVPWSEEVTEVVHLTEATFKPFLKKKKHVLVMFYAPWCGHCKKAKPEFNRAAEFFRDDPKVEFAAVDCTQFSALCNMFEVKGYPTIKYFHYFNKETRSYSGGRLEADFINFMQDPQKAGPPPEVVDSWADLEGAEHVTRLTDATFDAVLKTGQSILVMFYTPWCGYCKRLKPEFSLVAKQMKEEGIEGRLVAVDVQTNPGLQERFGISAFPTLKYFRNGQFIADYNGSRVVESLKEFMKFPPGSSESNDVMKDEL